MPRAKPEAWSTAINIQPVLIRIRDMQMPTILGAVIVGMSDEGCFEVVVQLAVADGDSFAGMRDVEEAVVEVFVMRHVGGDVAVVNPDVGGLLDTNGVAGGGKDSTDREIADDDVALGVD